MISRISSKSNRRNSRRWRVGLSLHEFACLSSITISFTVFRRGAFGSTAFTNQTWDLQTQPRPLPGSYYMSYTLLGGRGVCVREGAPARGPSHHLRCHQMLQQGRHIWRVTHCLVHILTRWWQVSLLPIAHWLELVTWSVPARGGGWLANVGCGWQSGKHHCDKHTLYSLSTIGFLTTSEWVLISLHHPPEVHEMHSRNGDTQAHLGLLKGASELGLGNWVSTSPTPSREGQEPRASFLLSSVLLPGFGFL